MLVRAHAKKKGHASEDDILGPTLVFVSLKALHEFGEGQWSHSDLVSSSAKLRHDVRGQQFGVAACHIDVDISHAQQAVEHTIEARGLVPAQLLVGDCVLHLVEHDVVSRRLIRYLGLQVAVKHTRVAQAPVRLLVQCNLYDMIVADP